MKRYIRTLLSGAVGLIGGTLGYFVHFPADVQIGVIILTGLIVMGFALYENTLQTKEDKDKIIQFKERLIFEMRHHLNVEFINNDNAPFTEVEAHELYRHYNKYDESLRIEAIAIVGRVSKERVIELLNIPVTSAELNILRVNKY